MVAKILIFQVFFIILATLSDKPLTCEITTQPLNLPLSVLSYFIPFPVCVVFLFTTPALKTYGYPRWSIQKVKNLAVNKGKNWIGKRKPVLLIEHTHYENKPIQTY